MTVLVFPESSEDWSAAADKGLFLLDADGHYRLAHDGRQWIVQRRSGKPSTRRLDGHAITDSGWRGTDYIGSEKRILHRCLAERGVVLTAEAQARLDALPERFATFIAAPDGLGFEVAA